METACSSRKALTQAIPFAALSATSGAGAANRLLWKGYLYDADLGCYCLGKRHYDPFALRFLEPDGIAYLDPSVPGGVNPYAYCMNDPVANADPSGQSVIGVLLAVVAAIGFTVAGGVAFQAVASLASYRSMLMASLWDEEVRRDLARIGYNPFNSDSSKVLLSSKVSFYKGVPVFRIDYDRSGTFGAIFLQREGEELSEGLVSHEYGHTFQLMTLGPLSYYLWIVIPSSCEWGVDKSGDLSAYQNSYYSRPWEAMASMAGGDSRHPPSASQSAAAVWHLIVAKFLGPFSYLFGLW